jgi:hypothetical protein
MYKPSANTTEEGMAKYQQRRFSDDGLFLHLESS